MQPRMIEQEEEVLLEEMRAAPRPWANRKVLGVVGVVGLVCTAAVLPRKWASRAPVEKMDLMQNWEPPPGFVPFAQAQAMSGGGAPAQPPVIQPAPGQPAWDGGYGAQQGYGAGVGQQGYGAGVGHGPQGQPIAAHPEGFVAHADAPAQQGNGGGGDKPATLNIYYESKCPFCKGFINDEVKPALSDPTCVFQHVHINWEPYGNVQDAGEDLMCQHGSDECFGNKLHLCAKKQMGGDEEALNRFITCHIEWLVQNPNGQANDMASYQNCGGDAQQLTQCANGGDIINDFRQVGAETAAAHSEHMPWAIMGNGQPNLQGMLVQGLCQQYGTGALAAYPKPSCCG